MKIYICLMRIPPDTDVRPCASFDLKKMQNHVHRVSDIFDVDFPCRVISLPDDAHFKRVIRGLQ